MLKADDMLKKNGAAGVLIGSLAEKIWSQKSRHEDLKKCKDVDVALLDYNFQPENFEGGIDWWVLYNGNPLLDYDENTEKAKGKNWQKNGFGIILPYLVDTLNRFEPGLYIPSREFLIDMRGEETPDCDTEVKEAFRKKMDERIKKRIPKYVRKEFQDQIFGEPYIDNPYLKHVFHVNRHEDDVLEAIHNYDKIS